MKAPACGTADTRPFLSNANETTGLRIFSVQTTHPTFPVGKPLALVNAGRTRGAGCPAHLSASSASNCAETAAQHAGATGPGAQQWVLEDAGRSVEGDRLVVISLAVSGWLMCTAGWLAGRQAGRQAGSRSSSTTH